MAATRKEEKYVDLGARYIFELIAVETLGVFNASARHLLDDLGSRISENTGEARETSFDFGTALQCCPFAWQFAGYRLHRLLIVPNFVFTFQFFLSPSGLYVPRVKKNNNNNN